MAAGSIFDRLCVVLVATRNPLNIGAAARAMSNLGFSMLRVVNPYEASFREARSAVGAAPLLRNAEEFTSVADAVADCRLVVGTTAGRNRQLHHPLRLLHQGAPVIRRQLRSGRAALLFGSEKRGLANADLSHCDWLLHIPTREQHLSMNLGQSVAVCLYELARTAVPARRARREGTRPDKNKQASAADLERLTSVLRETLDASGYLKQGLAGSEERLRRMVRRMGLTEEDARTWLGILRQIAWKLGRT